VCPRERQDGLAKELGEAADAGTALFFRHSAWYILLHLALGCFSVASLYRFTRSPVLWSPKEALFLGLVVSGVFVFAWLAGHLWWTASDLTLTPSSLIEVYRFRRGRVELPLASIVRVAKCRAFIGLSLSRIETADGRAIRVGVHLQDYARFLEALKARAVHCHDFDPYLSEFDSFRRRKRS
jgi:hypothetical protein